jgi:predicted PurR-regulated permease PerM
VTISDTKKTRAAILVLVLAVAILFAVAPYATGLLGAPVLYVIFGPVHRRLARRIPTGLAAALVILAAFLLTVVPGVWLIGMLVGQAQGVASNLANGTLFDRLSALRIGEFELGPELAGIGRSLISWLGGTAIGFIGTATHFTLDLIFSFFGLYYLLLSAGSAWQAFRPYIPFSDAHVQSLKERFKAVTLGTLVGTGLTALIQGVAIGLGFWFTGLSNPLFWGVVTVVFAILPVVGSGIVWIPGALSLLVGGHTGGAIVLAVIGLLAGQVHALIGPAITRHYAEVHPMITLVGAIAGVSHFGILGLLIGPLALSYFFELFRMYREEYLTE